MCSSAKLDDERHLPDSCITFKTKSAVFWGFHKIQRRALVVRQKEPSVGPVGTFRPRILTLALKWPYLGNQNSISLLLASKFFQLTELQWFHLASFVKIRFWCNISKLLEQHPSLGSKWGHIFLFIQRHFFKDCLDGLWFYKKKSAEVFGSLFVIFIQRGEHKSLSWHCY